MSNYYGDIRLGDTIDIGFTSRRFTTGAPFTLAGSPVISAYVGNSTTEITAGITLSVDFDGRTVYNNVRVVASSGNGYTTATNVRLVITTGTVDSVSVVGEVVASFSIENRSAVMPTTASRTLTIESDGMAHAGLKEWLGAAPAAYSATRGTAGTALPAAAANAAGGLVISIAGAMDIDNLHADVNSIATDVDSIEVAIAALNNITAASVWAVGTRTLTAGTNINGSTFTSIPWNASWDTEVQSEVQDAIEVNHLDHLLAVDYDPASKPGVATALFNELIESDAGVSRYTANALEQAPTGAGGDGSAFTAIPWNAAWDAEVQSECADALTAYDPPTHAELASGLAAADDAVLAAIALVAAGLPGRITKNVALSAFEFFMVDSTDHVTGKTGLTVTATRSLDGAAFGACANAVAEVANGIYKIDLAAADLNANVVTLKMTATGADARLITIVTQVT